MLKVVTDFPHSCLYQGRWSTDCGIVDHDLVMALAKFDLVSPWFGRFTDDCPATFPMFKFFHKQKTRNQGLLIPYFMGSEFAPWPSENFADLRAKVLEDPPRYLYTDVNANLIRRQEQVNPLYPDTLVGFYKIHDPAVRAEMIASFFVPFIRNNPTIDGLYFDNVWDSLAWVGRISLSGHDFSEIDLREISREEFNDRYRKGWSLFFRELRQEESVPDDFIILTNGTSRHYGSTNGRMIEGIMGRAGNPRTPEAVASILPHKQTGFYGPYSITSLDGFCSTEQTGSSIHLAKYFSSVPTDRCLPNLPLDVQAPVPELLLDIDELAFVISAVLMTPGMHFHAQCHPQNLNNFWNLKNYIRLHRFMSDNKYEIVDSLGPALEPRKEERFGVWSRKFESGTVVCDTIRRTSEFIV